jgi:hypothetical protein
MRYLDHMRAFLNSGTATEEQKSALAGRGLLHFQDGTWGLTKDGHAEAVRHGLIVPKCDKCSDVGEMLRVNGPFEDFVPCPWCSEVPA